MLITDDSGGTADGKERDQLQAMVAVGSEFITYRDGESTVQKSGEFVRIEKQSGEVQARFLLVHETAQTYTSGGSRLSGNELLNLAPDVKLRKRTRMFVSETDSQNGALPFREVNGFNTSSRISRYHDIRYPDRPNVVVELSLAQYTAQSGKRRLFAKGDGKVLLIREVAVPGDTRFFLDLARDTGAVGATYPRDRGLRAARVEIVEVNPQNGAASAPIFSFDVHSGLGFDPGNRRYRSGGGPGVIYDASYVYWEFAGLLFGSSSGDEYQYSLPNGGDASDTYAVAEPARVKMGDGRDYLSLIAVFPSSDDVYDSLSSGPYRLTCKRLTPSGDIAVSKINFPPFVPATTYYYPAAQSMSLHRLGPTTVVLRVVFQIMAYGAGVGGIITSGRTLFAWSHDDGATWTPVVTSPGSFNVPTYGGLLVKDKETLLAFSYYTNLGGTAPVMTVARITSSGITDHSYIYPQTFHEDLTAPLAHGFGYPDKYHPIGFGGAVYRKTADGKKKRLWMQFDPASISDQTKAYVLKYPNARPMLLVSDDGGLTWARKLLPTVWSFQAGFVVSVDETTLAVPVLAARKEPGAPVQAKIFVSTDGGDSWKPSGAQVTLPGESFADGQIVIGGRYYKPSGSEYLQLQQQDLTDASEQFNRGELLPLIALRDTNGRPLPANPARPWMNDGNYKEPTYA